jgi:predicted transcriptional regulator
MKTAVSIPDDLFAEAERLAYRLNRPRSQLYADALREYVARHDPDAITEALNHVIDTVASGPDWGLDPAFAAAGHRLLEREEW